MNDEEEELLSIEAHRVIITYSFDSNGEEFITIDTEDDMSNVLLLGILAIAKNRVLNAELYEDEWGEED